MVPNMYSIKSPNASKHMMTPFTDSLIKLDFLDK